MAKFGRFTVSIPKTGGGVSEQEFTIPAENTVFGTPAVAGPVADSGQVRYDITVPMTVSGFPPKTWTEFVKLPGTPEEYGTATLDGPVIVVEDPPKECPPKKTVKQPRRIRKAA